jgi:excinuclease ABC subunit C
VRPLSQLRAGVLQSSAEPDEVAVFLFEGGLLRGPVAFSTLGMRIQNEQSGSSSLFAQPMALEPVPERQGTGDREQGTEMQGLGTSHPSEQRPLAGDPDRDEGLEKQGIGSREQGIEKLGPGGAAAAARSARGMLEARLEAVLAELARGAETPNAVERQGHLALLKRWYYRPEVKRPGEVFFPDEEGAWPVKGILRGVGRVAAKSLPATVAGKS